MKSTSCDPQLTQAIPITDGDGFNDGLEVAGGSDPNDSASTPRILSFESDSENALEGSTITLNVIRTGDNAGAVDAYCSSRDGSAMAGSDYTAISQFLQWADGDSTTKPCSVDTTDDGPGDAGETFTLDLSNPTGGAQLGTPNTATVTITEPAVPMDMGNPITVDLNKDGTNDILLRNQNDGKWRWFELNGLTLNSQAFAWMWADPNWQVAAVVDFNGDGDNELLMRHQTTGAWRWYQLDGATVVQSDYIYMWKSLDWQLQTVADFNGDGKDEVLLRHATTGQWRWFGLDDSTVTGQTFTYIWSHLDWQIDSVADFDGDGAQDLLLRNQTTGQWRWYALTNNGTISAQNWAYIWKSPEWQTAAVADFDGNGKDDLLLRNQTSGQWRRFALDGANITTQDYVYAWKNLDWQLAGSGDFDGDGKADLLLRSQTTGQWRRFALDGATVTGQDYVYIWKHLDWQIENIADYNGDNIDDLLLRNQSTGEWRWYGVDGATINQQGKVDILQDQEWQVPTTTIH